MTSFTYNDITYNNVVYIDASASVSGTGVTPNEPMNRLPDLSGFAAQTAVVMRRTDVPLIAKFGPSKMKNDNIFLLGSPKISDSTYSYVPSANIWVNDAAEYATIFISGGNTAGSSIEFTGYNNRVERLKIVSSAFGPTHGTADGTIKCSTSNFIIKNCAISISGCNYNNATLASNGKNGINVSGSNNTIENCDIETDLNSIIFNSTNSSNSILNCKCKVWNPSYYVLYSQYACNKLNISSCSISAKQTQILYANIASFNITNCDFNILYTTNTNISRQMYFQGSPKGSIINCNFTSNNIYCNTYSYLIDVGSSANVTIKDSTFNTNNEVFTIGSSVTYMVTYGTKINYINCTFNTNGIIGRYDSDDTGNNIFSGCTFKKGTPAVHQPVYVECISGVSSGPQLTSRDNGILYAGSCSMSAATNKSIILSGNAKIFVDNLDVDLGAGPSYNYLNFNSSDDAAIYVKNELNIPGKWSARSLKTQILTTNTYRTGGKNYALKCYSFANSTTTPYLWIAPLPFNGIPVNFGTTGSKKISLYYAYKLYGPTTPVSLKDLVLEIEVPKDSTSSLKKLISSKSYGVISDDTSVWNNDTGLTIKRLDVYFDMLQAGDAICRIAFYKYDSDYTTGYTVIDPGLIGTDLS